MKRPGEILRERRETLQFSLQDMEAASGIPKKSLEALEADQYNYFAAEFYYYGFLKNYSEELRLDPEELMFAYRNVKILESPVPMAALTGKDQKKKLGKKKFFRLIWLIVISAGILMVFPVLRKNGLSWMSKSLTEKFPFGEKEGGQVQPIKLSGVLIDSYPSTQSLEHTEILNLLLRNSETEEEVLVRLEVLFYMNSYSLRVFEPPTYEEMNLSAGKTDVLLVDRYRFGFTLREGAGKSPSVLITRDLLSGRVN